VPPSARKLLSELGVLEAVEQAGFHPNEGNTVWWAGGPVRSETFADDDRGFHVDRAGLERVLGEAAETFGVRVHAATARAAEEEEGAWTVRCDGPDGTARSLRAPWVLDATGRHGLLARREGRQADRGTTTLALVRRFTRDDAWDGAQGTHTLVESYEDGWAWSVPLDARTRCVTAMVDQRHADLEGVDVSAMLDAELAKTRQLSEPLEGARPAGDAWACPASLYTASRFGRPGLLLVGDAGSFIDPLSSYGVKKALSSGWLAGVVAHTALVDPPMTRTAVELFDARERAVYESYRRVSARFFEEAAAAYGHAYWTARAEAARTAGTAADPSVADPDDPWTSALPEAEVRAAFDAIRSRERLAAERGPSVRPLERPAIHGHRVVLQPHLATDRCPHGMRWVRGVDLEALVAVAPSHAEVPDGWSAYNGVAAPVTLPDYLTALATAFAAGILVHGDDCGADSRATT